MDTTGTDKKEIVIEHLKKHFKPERELNYIHTTKEEYDSMAPAISVLLAIGQSERAKRLFGIAQNKLIEEIFVENKIRINQIRKLLYVSETFSERVHLYKLFQDMIELPDDLEHSLVFSLLVEFSEIISLRSERGIMLPTYRMLGAYWLGNEVEEIKCLRLGSELIKSMVYVASEKVYPEFLREAESIVKCSNAPYLGSTDILHSKLKLAIRNKDKAKVDNLVYHVMNENMPVYEKWKVVNLLRRYGIETDILTFDKLLLESRYMDDLIEMMLGYTEMEVLIESLTNKLLKHKMIDFVLKNTRESEDNKAWFCFIALEIAQHIEDQSDMRRLEMEADAAYKYLKDYEKDVIDFHMLRHFAKTHDADKCHELYKRIESINELSTLIDAKKAIFLNFDNWFLFEEIYSDMTCIRPLDWRYGILKEFLSDLIKEKR